MRTWFVFSSRLRMVELKHVVLNIDFHFASIVCWLLHFDTVRKLGKITVEAKRQDFWWSVDERPSN